MCVCVPPLFVCHSVPWAELKGHLEEQESYLNHVCECQYVCLDQSEVQGTDLRPMYRRDEGHFPGRPFLSSLCFFGWLAGWHWSSLISSEPTGLFLHLHIPSSRRQRRTRFHILFLFNSLADSRPDHFCLSAKCCIFIFPLPFVPCS